MPISVATAAAARPTKIEVSEPLIVLAMTSRPHLSPPKGSVAARTSAGAAVTAGAPLPDWMSFITSASGSTVDDGAASPPAAGFSPFNSAITSPIGSTTVERKSLAAVGPLGAMDGPALPPGAELSSGPTNVGGA